MKRALTLLGGMALGAGFTYFLDPSQGRRRRAALRDHAVHAIHKIDEHLNVAVADLTHRAQGLVAEVRTAFNHDEVSNDVLVERVRSEMGHLIAHPHSVQVAAANGHVVLSGTVSPPELEDLMACVDAVRGVRSVENRLETRIVGGDGFILQRQKNRVAAVAARSSHAIAHVNWSPAARLVASAVGCGLMANCMARRTTGAVLLGTAGFALFLRSVTNTELKSLAGLGTGGVINAHKTLTIAAPVNEVFAFWSDFGNFPRFMAHVREVRDLGGGGSQWVVVGPGGIRLGWHATLRKMIPNQLLAWATEPGSAIPNAGVVRFESRGRAHTRINVDISYKPPGGILGHFAAMLFGADPKAALDDDLVRLKSLLEHGKASAPGKKVTRAKHGPLHFEG